MLHYYHEQFTFLPSLHILQKQVGWMEHNILLNRSKFVTDKIAFQRHQSLSNKK